MGSDREWFVSKFTWKDTLLILKIWVFSRDSWNEPERVKGLDKVRVCAAFASGVISAVIGDDGSLWVWGRSKRGQLGLGKGIVEAIVPSRVEALAGEKIAKVGFLF